MFGWKDNTLQHAMDNNCFGPICNGLTTQGFDRANQCTVKPQVNEDNDGCKSPCSMIAYLMIECANVDADAAGCPGLTALPGHEHH